MITAKRTYLSLAVIVSLWPWVTAVAQPQLLPEQQNINRPIAGSTESTLPSLTPVLLAPIAQTSSRTELASLSSANRDRLHQLLTRAQAESWPQKPYPQLIQSIAEQFLGADYRAGLLDGHTNETLVISLQEFDCVLFIEAILSLSKAVLQAETLANSPSSTTQQDIASTTFVNSVESYRYRDGKLQNYCDRLHYFSDWILDNQRRGNVSAVPQLQVQPLNKTIHFMGNHRSSYPQLLKSDGQYDCIRNAESRLNQTINRESNSSSPFGYIPTSQIRSQYPQLQAGDIVAVATSVSGLDVTHTGLVYRHPDGNLGLIHAAPNAGVILAGDLQTYIERVDSAIGIIVTRPNLQAD